MKHLSFLLLIAFYAQLPAQAPALKATKDESVLRVLVVDDKNKPQGGQEIVFVSSKTGKTFSGTTDAAGKFSTLIPPGQKYKVTYKIFNSKYDDLDMDMPVSEHPYSMDYTITVTPPRTFRLDNVFFDSGKSTIRPESDKELNELFDYMTLKKTLVVEIAGHTDNVGSSDSNQKLSEDRANSVKQYLVKKGIATNRIVAKGYGDTQPVADNGSAAGRQQNRRTEVHILSE